MQSVIKTIRKELKTIGTEDKRISIRRFFVHEIKVHGVNAAEVKKLAKTYFAQIMHLPKKEIFDHCELLWQSGYLEESGIACEWVKRIHQDLTPADWIVFERWVDEYITNWARCDNFCGGTVGAFLEVYPQYVRQLRIWAKSANLWKRRAAAVSLTGPARKGLFHDEVFDIAKILLLDKEDMVQKGYGWMLKEASNFDQQSVFQFILQHKAEMPRTSLRYAIEKMPKRMKERAMKKDK